MVWIEKVSRWISFRPNALNGGRQLSVYRRWPPARAPDRLRHVRRWAARVHTARRAKGERSPPLSPRARAVSLKGGRRAGSLAGLDVARSQRVAGEERARLSRTSNADGRCDTGRLPSDLDVVMWHHPQGGICGVFLSLNGGREARKGAEARRREVASEPDIIPGRQYTGKKNSPPQIRLGGCAEETWIQT